MWVPVERKGCGVRVDVGIDPYDRTRGAGHPKKFSKIFPSVVHFKATMAFFIPIGRET